METATLTCPACSTAGKSTQYRGRTHGYCEACQLRWCPECRGHASSRPGSIPVEGGELERCRCDDQGTPGDAPPTSPGQDGEEGEGPDPTPAASSPSAGEVPPKGARLNDGDVTPQPAPRDEPPDQTEPGEPDEWPTTITGIGVIARDLGEAHPAPGSRYVLTCNLLGLEVEAGSIQEARKEMARLIDRERRYDSPGPPHRDGGQGDDDQVGPPADTSEELGDEVVDDGTVRVRMQERTVEVVTQKMSSGQWTAKARQGEDPYRWLMATEETQAGAVKELIDDMVRRGLVSRPDPDRTTEEEPPVAWLVYRGCSRDTVHARAQEDVAAGDLPRVRSGRPEGSRLCDGQDGLDWQPNREVDGREPCERCSRYAEALGVQVPVVGFEPQEVDGEWSWNDQYRGLEIELREDRVHSGTVRAYVTRPDGGTTSTSPRKQPPDALADAKELIDESAERWGLDEEDDHEHESPDVAPEDGQEGDPQEGEAEHPPPVDQGEDQGARARAVPAREDEGDGGRVDTKGEPDQADGDPDRGSAIAGRGDQRRDGPGPEATGSSGSTADPSPADDGTPTPSTGAGEGGGPSGSPPSPFSSLGRTLERGTDYDVSASEARAWLRCEKQWAFRYLEGLREPAGPKAQVGLLCHEAIARVTRARLERWASSWDPADLAPPEPDELAEAIPVLEEKPDPSVLVETREVLREGAGLVHLEDAEGAEVEGVWTTPDGVRVYYRWDRIDRLGPDTIRVVDYKTGRWVPTHDELLDDPQVLWYLAAAADEYGAERVLFQPVYLRAFAGSPIELTEDRYGAAVDLARAVHEGTDLVREGDLEAEADPGVPACLLCDHRTRCEDALAMADEDLDGLPDELAELLGHRERAKAAERIAQRTRKDLDARILPWLRWADQAGVEVVVEGEEWYARERRRRQAPPFGRLVGALAQATGDDPGDVADEILSVGLPYLDSYVGDLEGPARERAEEVVDQLVGSKVTSCSVESRPADDT